MTEDFDTIEFNRLEKLELIEDCNGPNLNDCCFDCEAHRDCQIEGKCGGEFLRDFHGDCSHSNDTRCPHHLDYVLPPFSGCKLRVVN